jgi:hypothetical protein
MEKVFNVYMIIRKGEPLLAPWNPQPPMIFSNEQAALDHCETIYGDRVVKGRMIFETEENI